MPSDVPTIIATSIGFDSRGRDRTDWDAGPVFDLAADLSGATGTPKVCFLGTATGDDAARLAGVYSALADRFLAHMLARNIRVEEDLVDQLFNSSEKRLARALLLLARYGTDSEQLLLPKVSQETLAKIVGTTRSRVNFFMNKFRDLGFLTYDDAITVHRSLLTVVLHD